MPLRLAFCIAAPAALLSGAATGQGSTATFPSRPVTMIVSTSPGGPNDAEARLYATKMTELMGQSFILDFKPGAGSTIGAAYVAKSPPDGYTLLTAGASFTVFPALYPDLTFDTIKDLTAVSLMSLRSSVLLASKSFAPQGIREYLAYAKANPGKINFATSGAGGANHLAGAWLHSMTDTKVTFVHYKGTGPLMVDLLAGRVDVAPTSLITSVPLVKSGKVRALAMMNDQQSALLPGVTSVAQQGVTGYNPATWFGILAPGATPAAIVNKLAEGFVKVANSPDVAGALEADGGTMVGSTPAEFRKVIVNDTARWRTVIREAGIRLEP